MTTTTGRQVRKRQILTGMKYDRVDLVPDGANGHANILIAKNRTQQPKTVVTRKAMGTVTCNKCGASNPKNAKVCQNCGSTNLAKTLVEVTKTVQNPKKVPKNDDATNSTANASGFTFEDEQYDQDNAENIKALGDDSRESSVNKSWFEVEVGKADKSRMTPQTGKTASPEDIDSVNDQEEDAWPKEGGPGHPDMDVETASMTLPVGLKPDKRKGYISGNTTSNDVMTATAKSRKLKKKLSGRNSFDYTDQGSQEVAESAEQMYRSQSQPTREAQDRRESTLSDVFSKARRRRSNKEGLDVLDHGNSGIYQRPGVKRNGTGTGHNKTTNAGRTAVAPPKNPLDVGKSLRVRKNRELPTLEALNLGVGLAENMDRIVKANRPELYEAAMKKFITDMNAAAQEWFAGSSVTKSKDTSAQAQDVYDRVAAIIQKASPEAEMSDEASEGEDADDVDSKRPSIPSKKSQNAGEDNTSVGKNRVNKSLKDDPFANLHPDVVDELRKAREFREEREQQVYLEKARQLNHLPNFDEKKIAKQLRAAYEEGTEEGDYLFTTLAASANIAKDSTIFKQFGVTGVGSGLDESNPMNQAHAWADSQIAKSAAGTTKEQLVYEYMMAHPGDFYTPAKMVS